MISSYNAKASETVELSTNGCISCLVRGDDDDIRFNSRANQNTVDVLRSAGCCRASRAQDARRVRLVHDVGCLGGIATSAGNDCGDDSVFERTFDLISLLNRDYQSFLRSVDIHQFCSNGHSACVGRCKDIEDARTVDVEMMLTRVMAWRDDQENLPALL